MQTIRRRTNGMHHSEGLSAAVCAFFPLFFSYHIRMVRESSKIDLGPICTWRSVLIFCSPLEFAPLDIANSVRANRTRIAFCIFNYIILSLWTYCALYMTTFHVLSHRNRATAHPVQPILSSSYTFSLCPSRHWSSLRPFFLSFLPLYVCEWVRGIVCNDCISNVPRPGVVHTHENCVVSGVARIFLPKHQRNGL